MFIRLLFATFVLFFTACGDEPSGSPPSISQLNYSPSLVTVGQVTTVQGTLVFEDPDGDVLELLVVLSEPNGNDTETALEIAGADGETSGVVTLQLSLLAPMAGTYSFTVRVADDNGNESNPLTGSIVAE